MVPNLSIPSSRPRVLALLAGMIGVGVAWAAGPTPEQIEFFENRIRPVLVESCHECHSAKAAKTKGGLHLDSATDLAKGGDSGPIVMTRDPEASLLLKAVRYADPNLAMPPTKKLSATRIADFEVWVRMGAPWPAGEARPASTPATGIAPDPARTGREHWAFQPVLKPEPPPVATPGWVRNPIDRFVLARLEIEGLKPSPAAGRPAWIRRATLDLLGLPPTPEEVHAFVSDVAPNAFERVVDRLLASPRYGERWGRHWLDVARYSDGFGGFLDSEPLPHAWRYRDWVVSALNEDLPYDAFLREQIAGNLAGTNNATGSIATGFFAVGPTYVSDGGDPEAEAQARAETLADRVDTFSRAFLGLTVACARCHDHKFDPIPTRDYYALAGIFNNTRSRPVPTVPPAVVEVHDAARKVVESREKALQEVVVELRKRVPEKSTNALDRTLLETLRVPSDQLDPARLASGPDRERVRELQSSLRQARDAVPAPYPKAHVLVETGHDDLPVAIRGDLRKPGAPAPRRFLSVVAGNESAPFRDGSGLRELARAVTDPANPLVARVLVNRVWHHHFGQGLVRTPSNFGVLGEKPSHPELLDWLAATFIEQGWSLKRLHRLILLSATWRMDSRHDEASFARDGENRFLWRMPARRLEVESWRDACLAVTGELDPTLGGAPAEHILDQSRRTLYATISRNGDRFVSDEFFRLFDFPAPRTTSESRSVSTVPQQYLFLLNSDFMAARARALADRLDREADTDAARLERGYRLLYARPPTPEEAGLGLRFLAAAPRGERAERWRAYAQVLLAAQEFRQVP